MVKRRTKYIRNIWHRWHDFAKVNIPDGFRVLTNKYDSIPTALSIRNKLKALVPTSYNCYLLDSLSLLYETLRERDAPRWRSLRFALTETLRERDIRRYLGKAARHD